MCFMFIKLNRTNERIINMYYRFLNLEIIIFIYLLLNIKDYILNEQQKKEKIFGKI